MKKLITIVSISFIISCNSQHTKRAPIGDTEFQRTQNAKFKDASKSPLTNKDLKEFKGLDFFPVDSTFRVIATLTKTVDAKIFEMPTTTDRRPLYKEYGILTFTLQGVSCKLSIYQNQDEDRDPEYKDYLFLPFTDDTSGNESYGGGRYMDVLTTDERTDGTILLDFNNTYNPYCAYNKRYSCPITPRKNHLDLEIKAGIKDFKKEG